jgi:hypothetical protein
MMEEVRRDWASTRLRCRLGGKEGRGCAAYQGGEKGLGVYMAALQTIKRGHMSSWLRRLA